MTKAKNCLFVSGLNYYTKESDIRELFESCGEIESVEIVKTSENKSKGFGYIAFGREQDAELALETKYGVHLHHRRLHLEYCRPKLRIKTGVKKEENDALQKLREQEEFERAKQVALRLFENKILETNNNDDSTKIKDTTTDLETKNDMTQKTFKIDTYHDINEKNSKNRLHKKEEKKEKTRRTSRKKMQEYSPSYSDYSYYSDYYDYSDYSNSYYSDYYSYSYSSDYSPSPKKTKIKNHKKKD